MPIREGSCCITTDWILAVSEPASESILHLGRREEGGGRKEEGGERRKEGGGPVVVVAAGTGRNGRARGLKPGPTSLRRMQCTMTMTKPCSESKTAKRI